MADVEVKTVRIGAVSRLESADTLSITKVFGCPVIFRTGDYVEGQLATYIPVDAIVPDTPQWEFLGGKRRIMAKRLRGVFSMGLLTDPVEGALEGDDVAEVLGITKWDLDDQEPTDTAPPPLCVSGLSAYALSSLRQFPQMLVDGEEVVITEKIHGASFRAVWDGEKLHVGSRTRWLKQLPECMYWTAAREHFLDRVLMRSPGVVILGEVYGQVMDMRYGVKGGFRLAFFDMWSQEKNGWYEEPQFGEFLKAAPELYRGPWSPELVSLAEGQSTVPGANHVREGFVVRPVKARRDPVTGRRVALKMHGEAYLTRKSARAK